MAATIGETLLFGEMPKSAAAYRNGENAHQSCVRVKESVAENGTRGASGRRHCPVREIAPKAVAAGSSEEKRHYI